MAEHRKSSKGTKGTDGRRKALSSKPVPNPVHAGAKQRFSGVYKYSKQGPKG